MSLNIRVKALDLGITGPLSLRGKLPEICRIFDSQEEFWGEKYMRKYQKTHSSYYVLGYVNSIIYGLQPSEVGIFIITLT